MSWLLVTMSYSGMMHFTDLVCCAEWSVSSEWPLLKVSVIEASDSWMCGWFHCFYHTPSGRYFADVPLETECLPDGVVFGIVWKLVGCVQASYILNYFLDCIFKHSCGRFKTQL
jgi:hypothetical protein